MEQQTTFIPDGMNAFAQCQANWGLHYCGYY